ncbi:hypothetical protein Nepgr_028585 [Nepenthes gracilis]|uniref:RING-type domain-containing protein n=1 Tax=Nepenthes gracilis TaxID=150966 RepID=A0AAD3Y292_NEPGR|nr:hypothetical protein Nepgr_028585 [Nepenthes gracilis]
MAVQAQYPSNVLLVNRNGQEGRNVLGGDYSLQLHPGGGRFIDQSPMISNINGVVANNPRKRGREAAATAPNTTAAPAANIISPLDFNFTNQQHPQLIEPAQLQNHLQNNVVSTGLRLSFGEQHQQLHQQQHQNSLPSHSSILPSLLNENFAHQMKQQSDELNQFIQAQGEQLRRMLSEKRQRHYRELLGAAEEAVARRLREKEAEVEKAAKCHAELEARVAQLSAEAQVWQAKARSQEARAASLQAQLQQAIMSCGIGSARLQLKTDGAEMLGSAVEGGGQAEDAESAYVDPERVCSPSCKACRKRVASVVLLPCRHLCVCAECDALVQACPLCLSLRNGGVEVFLT